MKGQKWTEEQHKKFKATMKKRADQLKKGMTNGKVESKTGHQQPDIPEAVLAYAMGRTEAWIEGYAASERVSPRTLAYRMGQLLQRKAGR